MTDHGALDSSVRLEPVFVDGAMLAAAAVPDSVLIYVSGACIKEHFDNTCQAADWAQNLVVDGPRTRLALTFSDLTMGILGTASAVEKVADHILGAWRPSVFFLAELSRVTLAGEELASTAADLEDRTGVPTVALSSKSLTRDYQAAYRAALTGLADRLSDAAFGDGLRPGTAAIVGYFHERNENDQKANVACMESLVRDAGLEPLPTWLSNAPLADLSEAARASVLVALPLGREAARRIAGRSGARVVEAELPVGLAGTEDFLRRVAEASGGAVEVDRVVESGLGAVVPDLTRAVLRRIAGRRAALAALPDWHDGVVRMMKEEMGLDLAVRVRRERAADPSNEMAPASQELGRDHDPSVDSWNRQVGEAIADGGLDVIVGSSWEHNSLRGDARDIPFLEFGYPCFTRHDLTGRPLLGFKGTLTWAELLTDALR